MTHLYERTHDATKVPLAPEFLSWLRGVALANGLTADIVWLRWQEYERACTGYDQSPVQFEFLNWNKLKEPKS